MRRGVAEGERCQRIRWWLLHAPKTLGLMLTCLESSDIKAGY